MGSLGLFREIPVHACEETTWGQAKRLTKGVETSPRTHTGLGEYLLSQARLKELKIHRALSRDLKREFSSVVGNTSSIGNMRPWSYLRNLKRKT